ncbi:MAG: hypothetical protein ACJ72O_09565 [Marmoricola sp.]
MPVGDAAAGAVPGPRWPARVTTVLVTVLVLGPLLVSGGIALRGDMVFVPDQPWKSAWLGLDGSVPRAVPMDALVSLVDDMLPGALLQRVLLAAALLLGGFGIARLAGRFAALGQVAAVVVYLWNPWVHERLEIGQWPTVMGYGLLPWLVLGAIRVRDRVEGGWPRLALVLVASAVCAPSVGLLGVVVALVVVLVGPDRRRCWGVLGLGLLANLPWVVPSLLRGSIRGTDLGFGAFAARGESSLGTVASLLSMGGIWKTSVVAPERTNAVVVAAAALLSLALLAGYRYAAPAIGRRSAISLGWVGAGAFLLALLPADRSIADALGDLSVHVPALAILRDSQRSLAPLGLVLALGAAALVDRLVSGSADRAADQRPGDRSGRLAGAALLVAAPVVLLPSMAWGLSGDLDPVHYPREWSQVAAVVAKDPGPVVVLPWTGSYRGFGWNHDRAVLDPAPRFLPGTVLVDDRVFLRGAVVPSEDPALVRVGRALSAADPAAALSNLGVRWVLVEKGNGAEHVPAGELVHDGRDLALVQMVDAETAGEFSRHRPPVWPVSLANATAASVVVISIWSVTRHKGRNKLKTM